MHEISNTTNVFSGDNKKNIPSLLSAEFAQRMVKVNMVVCEFRFKKNVVVFFFCLFFVAVVFFFFAMPVSIL